jgi:tryptophan-rich sensory protein
MARSLLALAGFLAACFLVAAIGGWFTSMGMPEWYAALEKPSWTPPSWVFGPAWTTLYILMAVAAWLVWKEAGFSGASGAMVLFFTQLALNLAWSGIFFALQRPGWALVELGMLWIAILATTALFFRHSGAAGALMLPYLAWVTFAGALNAAIVRLN